MWIWTQAKNKEGQTYLLDMNKVETVTIIAPAAGSEFKTWQVVAACGSTTWVLADSLAMDEAVALQRRIYHSLAAGEKALNLHALRRNAEE